VPVIVSEPILSFFETIIQPTAPNTTPAPLHDAGDRSDGDSDGDARTDDARSHDTGAPLSHSRMHTAASFVDAAGNVTAGTADRSFHITLR
jgi:hypothetical protein